jgi:hypothetical protein
VSGPMQVSHFVDRAGPVCAGHIGSDKYTQLPAPRSAGELNIILCATSRTTP